MRLESSDASSKVLGLQSDVFVVDWAGDLRNLTFGTLDRYATPVYSRIGAGNIVGSSLSHTIDRAASSEKQLVLSAFDRLGNRGKPPLRSMVRGESRELRVKKQLTADAASDRAVDFINLGYRVSAKRKRGENGTSPNPSSSEDERNHYRSILGKPLRSNEPNDPDLVYASEASSSGRHVPSTGALVDHLQRKRMELTRRVDSDPSSAEAWMQLIHHQESFIGPRPTNAERRSTADIKISMYEKALDAVKDMKGREDLLMEMMVEAATILDGQSLSAQWRKILQTNPSILSLWTAYLDFKQTEFSAFRYEEVQNVFLDCMRMLEIARTQIGKDTSESDKIHETQIFILLRMTLYMRESGFLEHGVATWQALLEYEIFPPPEFKSHTCGPGDSFYPERTQQFEHFWESEVPRIGEDGAEGWANFYVKNGRPPESKTRVGEQVGHVGDLFSAWIIAERRSGLLAQQPARTIDDIPENDPYRVILFSDIKPFLIRSASLNGQHVLLEAFLVFCQLPSYQPNSKARIWRRDGFVRNEALYVDGESMIPQNADPDNKQDLAYGMPLQDVPRHSPFGFPVPDYQVDTGILFSERRSWFSALDSWQKTNSIGASPIEPEWVLRALKSLIASEIGDDELAEYVLALELCISPESAKKTARGLLKKRTSSLRLYNAYALIEYRLGNATKGENALVASINMSRDLYENARRDCILLWRTWIWELLGEGNSRGALHQLQAYGDSTIEASPPENQADKSHNPAKILRTENALTAFRDNMLSLQSRKHAALAMECMILFAYLKDISTLSAATKVFKLNLHLLSVISGGDVLSEETLHQSFARLLHHHATHTHLFKPSDIRSLLTESIAQFPQNTTFLSLYAWNETRFRIDDRVRSIVEDVVLGANSDSNSKESVVSHFFAIHSELKRGVNFGSNNNAVRATFERAVESRSGAHCAGIWKTFFLFEHSRGTLKKATEVFYRGIRACPWAKELYLLPFDYLRGSPGGMREADLKAVYDLIVEKELRLHVDLEELIEQREDRPS